MRPRAMLAVLIAACSPVTDPELLITPDPDLTLPAPAGQRGPYGAALVEAHAQARVTDAIDLDIIYPADRAGSPAVQGAPVVVFIHGGLVAPERYHWLPAYLATRGWASVLPQADLNLAIAEPGNGRLALERLHALSDGPGLLADLVDDGPVITMGHSLGGVLAAEQWARDEAIDGLVLLASFPADTTPVADGTGPVLALTGLTDVFDWERLEEQLERATWPTTDARIEGMNHYAWTDDASPADLEGDGPQLRPVSDTRADAMVVLDTWLDVYLFDGDAGALSGPFDGVELRMILALLSLAWADPVALRMPHPTAGASVGLHDLSVAAPLGGDAPWLAAHVATSGGSAGASVGQRWVVAGADKVASTRVGVAGGVLAPLVVPGIALTATPWIHSGWVGRDASFIAGAALPLAVGTGGLRVPLLFELQGGVRAGPVLLGGRLAAGPVWTPGLDIAAFLEPALTVQLAP